MALYADVVEIVAPTQAVPGSRVDITVKIKNTYSGTISILVGGALEYGLSPWPGIDFPEQWANVNPGATYSFFSSFIMPAARVTVHAYSYWYCSDDTWYFDDELTKVINLHELTPQISDFKILDFARI